MHTVCCILYTILILPTAYYILLTKYYELYDILCTMNTMKCAMYYERHTRHLLLLFVYRN